MIPLAIALILTLRSPHGCEAIARETAAVCRWPNIDGAHTARCDRLNPINEACKRKAKP